MLSFLLDEHVSPDVAVIVRRLRPEIPVVPLLDWHDGLWIGQTDEEILRAANLEGLSLVTYDQRTIPKLLQQLAAASEPHGGVVFVDQRTILQNEVPTLAHSIIRFWDQYGTWDWSCRLAFLRRS
jgi:hypothetical protein